MKASFHIWLGLIVLSFEHTPRAADLPMLNVRIEPRFGNTALQFDSREFTTASNQTITVSRLDWIATQFRLKQDHGGWVGPANASAFLSGGGRSEFLMKGIPRGHYTRFAFLVGLPPDQNKADPSRHPAEHPLNPAVNGLHWGWQGGYVFLALEGTWRDGHGARNGYSWHLATDRQLMQVDLPVDVTVTTDLEMTLALDIQRILDGPHRVFLGQENSATHSRTDDPVADQLRENVEEAFRFVSARQKESLAGKPLPPRTVLVASSARRLPIELPRGFPVPALPDDNPLTEEGVTLGRTLFLEKRLSINGTQACATCHQESAAFCDAGKAVSTGAEGQVGTRNSMALFNLAWKQSFFWDGRTPTLREQVLQPVQNPVEMHESLDRAVGKLRNDAGSADPGYPSLFARAFGSPEINADRIARALEQYLLTLLARDSKFDRVMAGQDQFNTAERLGFELFHTEYDPGRGRRGADCFHCHGGPLFQSKAFANNGLDEKPLDAGRSLVTGRSADLGKFAVPSLRNVAVTGPYMHDGRFATLEQVVEHYCTGVKRSDTLDPNLAKHPAGGVPLTADEKHALVAFLKTLDSGPAR